MVVGRAGATNRETTGIGDHIRIGAHRRIHLFQPWFSRSSASRPCCHSQVVCGENDFFIVLSYFFVRSIIAEMKETRSPNNIGANTVSSSVTTKYTERIKENTREPIMLIFFILEYPFQ